MAIISTLYDKWYRHNLSPNIMKITNPKKKRPPRKLKSAALYYIYYPNNTCYKMRSLNIIIHIKEEITGLLIMFNNG